MNHNDKTWQFSINVPLNAEASVDNFPWSLIDGIEIHEDSDGHLFTFFDLLASQELDRQVKAIRVEVEKNINILRGFFALELDITDASVPDTWDAMSALFLQWLTTRVQESEARVTDESKAHYAELRDDEA